VVCPTIFSFAFPQIFSFDFILVLQSKNLREHQIRQKLQSPFHFNLNPSIRFYRNEQFAVTGQIEVAQFFKVANFNKSVVVFPKARGCPNLQD
jgi:hypothetical protein